MSVTLFMYLLAICMHSWEECLFSFFVHFLIELVFFVCFALGFGGFFCLGLGFFAVELYEFFIYFGY